MADRRFGCEADIAGPAAGSTRSLVTRSGPRLVASDRVGRKNADITVFHSARGWAITAGVRAASRCQTRPCKINETGTA